MILLKKTHTGPGVLFVDSHLGAPVVFVFEITPEGSLCFFLNSRLEAPLVFGMTRDFKRCDSKKPPEPSHQGCLNMLNQGLGPRTLSITILAGGGLVNNTFALPQKRTRDLFETTQQSTRR